MSRHSTSPRVGPTPRFLTVSLAHELGVLLCLSVLFPFMIHLLPFPEDSRLGPRLLPMFYAPLLAALVGRMRSALVVALLAPWLNWALTTHPPPPLSLLMTIELLGFVGMLRWLLARLGPRWFLAAPAFLAGKAGSVLLGTLWPELIRGGNAFNWGLQAIATGLPGIAILVLINWLVVRHYPAGPSGGGPAAA